MAKTVTRNDDPAAWFGTMRHYHAFAVITLLVAFFFRDILLQKAFFWEDFIYQYYAFRDFAAVSLSRGELPLWNPYTFNGMPFQADIQTALFYIPNLLLTLAVQGDRLHFLWVEALIVAHFVVAGFSMYLLSVNFGLERPYALFSGMVYALSGFMITHAIHHTFISQVAWTPLVLLLFRKTILDRSLFAMLLAGLVLGHSILGGAPQFTLYTFLFLLAYFLFELIAALRSHGLARSWTMIPLGAGVIVLAVALTAIQLLPTVELAGLSARAEITFEKSSESSLEWEQLVTILVPKFFGASGAQGSTYWLAQSAWDYWETCLYVGIPGLIAVAGAIPLARKNRTVAFLFGVMIFSLLYALGDNFVLHSFFFHVVPGFDKFRIPGRMSFLFTLCAAALSGFGLRWLFCSMTGAAREFQQFLVTAAALGAAGWIAAQAGIFQPSENAALYRQIHPAVVSGATTALLLILVVCAILLLAQRKIFSGAIALVAILLVQVADVHVFGYSQNNGDLSPEVYYGRTAELVKAIKKDGETEYFRVNSRKGGAMMLDRNQGMVDRIFLMEGYTPLGLQRIYPPGASWPVICDMLNAKYRITLDSEKRTMGMETATGYLPRANVVYDARIMRDSLVAPFMASPAFDPSRMVVLEERPDLPVADTSYDPGWSAGITHYSENAIALSVTMPKNGYLVLSEIYYPGWNATIDGTKQQLYRADWNLRAVPVAAGTHAVEVRFEPESFARGAWISAGALLCALGGLFYSRRSGARRHQGRMPA